MGANESNGKSEAFEALAQGKAEGMIGMEFDGETYKFVSSSGGKSSSLNRNCTAAEVKAALREIYPDHEYTIKDEGDGRFLITPEAPLQSSPIRKA